MYNLEDFGSFMIPGRTVQITGQHKRTVTRNENMVIEVDPNGAYHIENTYVEYFIPVGAKHSVVLVHGGGMCGNVWNTTPDGRKGWLHLLLAQKFAVYIVDTVERGRAGWCPLPGIWAGEPELRNAEASWEAFRIGEAKQFNDRVAFKHQQFPIDFFDQLVNYQVPRWDCNAQKSAQGLAALIQKIKGKCFIIAHSLGCDLAMRALDMQPDKIEKIILVEPSGAYPIKSLPEHGIKVMIVWGDNIEKNPMWISLRDLSLTYQQSLLAQGAQVDFIRLPSIDIHGNSHMLMMDKNNEIIAKLLIKWLKS
jgi:pimeloyl-ACP methyl ester carboxylesterase